jgi:hypothetical protein
MLVRAVCVPCMSGGWLPTKSPARRVHLGVGDGSALNNVIRGILPCFRHRQPCHLDRTWRTRYLRRRHSVHRYRTYFIRCKRTPDCLTDNSARTLQCADAQRTTLRSVVHSCVA